MFFCRIAAYPGLLPKIVQGECRAKRTKGLSRKLMRADLNVNNESFVGNYSSAASDVYKRQDRGSARKDGGVENNIILVCLYRTYPFLPCHVPQHYRAQQERRVEIFRQHRSAAVLIFLCFAGISPSPLCRKAVQ